MEKYFPVAKLASRKTTLNGKQEQGKPPHKNKNSPYENTTTYERKPGDWKEKKRVEKLLAPLLKDGAKPSKAALTKHLLKTLSDESNPITHSDIYLRTVHVTSTTTGHQRGEGKANQATYLESRRMKLKDQLLPEEASTSVSERKVLANVRVYIDGFLENTTDIEMKRIVTEAGGRVMYTASGATHVLTSQQLNSSKTHKLLTTSARIKVHVVRPEWITESIQAGKRLPERYYTVVKNNSVISIADMFGKGNSSKNPIELD